MKDDYLWDRTGEPDVDIADLEKRLSVFKYRERSFKPKATSVRQPARSVNWTAIAAAFAGVAVLALALWLALNRSNRENRRDGAQQAENHGITTSDQKTDGRITPAAKPTPAVPEIGDSNRDHADTTAFERNTPQPRPLRQVTSNAPAGTHTRTQNMDGRGSEPDREQPSTNAVAVQVTNSPLIDPETARHIERAQTLLVSFKNSSPADGRVSSDVAEDRNRCRAILSSNILLRKNAEQRGNLPIQELLGNLEPFLLDIANLPDRPSAADVRDIQNRIKKNEILVALEVYSPPALDGAF